VRRDAHRPLWAGGTRAGVVPHRGSCRTYRRVPPVPSAPSRPHRRALRAARGIRCRRILERVARGVGGAERPGGSRGARRARQPDDPGAQVGCAPACPERLAGCRPSKPRPPYKTKIPPDDFKRNAFHSSAGRRRPGAYPLQKTELDGSLQEQRRGRTGTRAATFSTAGSIARRSHLAERAGFRRPCDMVVKLARLREAAGEVLQHLAGGLCTIARDPVARGSRVMTFTVLRPWGHAQAPCQPTAPRPALDGAIRPTYNCAQAA